MAGIILAPYNESMSLGQGYNSYLQTPCIKGAMEYDQDELNNQLMKEKPVSQAISHDSRLVDTISEVLQAMNISAGSAVKSGVVASSGTTISLDEEEFTSSDIKAVLSVKVINRKIDLRENAVFTPTDHVKMLDSRKFFDIYGDSYISGFIDGGELNGVVSIKLLNMSEKAAVEHALKVQMNNAKSPSQVTPSEDGDLASSKTALSRTETTVNVNWSGGGQLKPEDQEWTLDSFLQAASAFPAMVAACPQRTWAILTPYDQNKTFVAWAEKNKITVPRFQIAQAHTSRLLDMYMLYKNNLARVQSVLSDPTNYTAVDSVPLAVEVSIDALLTARKQIRDEMRKIVAEVDELCYDPENARNIKEHSSILPPEVWAKRLPISSQQPTDTADADTQ